MAKTTRFIIAVVGAGRLLAASFPALGGPPARAVVTALSVGSGRTAGGARMTITG